jgi:hypothetical protein
MVRSVAAGATRLEPCRPVPLPILRDGASRLLRMRAEIFCGLAGAPLLIDLITLAGTYASTAAPLAVFDMQLAVGETHLLPSLE